jgi:hypothetical protein
MKLRPALALVVILAVVAFASVSAAAPAPYVNSAGSVRRHVVVVFMLGDLSPGRLVVASRGATKPNGELEPANVKLDEPLRVSKVAAGFRATSRHTLRRGRYFVQVSGLAQVDCLPHKPCPQDWSNVRRVRVR